jgi:hypothetical protein
MVSTADTKKKSGVSGGTRIIIALLVSISLGLFILFWDSKNINYISMGIPYWAGTLIILPLMAVVLSYGGNCLIQQLSCSQVQWLVQLQRVAIVPIPFYCMWLVLYILPIMRWPIEGLIQNVEPSMRLGLSSAFYTFWISLYSQGLLNGLAQICPK